MGTSKPRKSTRLNANVWYEEDDGCIHLTFAGTQAAVSRKATSVMGHPKLFAKLAKVLRDAKLPHPEIDEKVAAEE